MSQPGFVDDSGCVSQLAAFPDWTEPLPLQQRLQDHFSSRHHCGDSITTSSVFVSIFEDARSALAAELTLGEGRLRGTVALITVGTGLGIALGIRGEIFSGRFYI